MTAPTQPDETLLWLNTPDQHWEDHHEAWERDERRLYGGDLVLSELTPFAAEEKDSYSLRTRTARYSNLPDQQMSLIAGHIIRAMRDIEFGSMGEVRERRQITTPTLAEIFTYNCDGVGQDGTQFKTWADGVVKRAGATGYRVVMVEMPRLTTLANIRERARGGVAEEEPAPTPEGEVQAPARLTEQDRAMGWHPYLVEYSPLNWIRRSFTEGTLDYAVLRVKVPTTATEDNKWQTEEDGLYILVRNGYDGLGTKFAVGGWWLLAANYSVIDEGRWDLTRGQIPLVVALAEHNLGTVQDPAIGRSLTMELGQIAIDMMNARSEQRYNARQAAKTLLFIMGGDTKTSADIGTQLLAGSMVVTVPPTEMNDGTKVVPQVWSSSSVALDTAVYSNILAEALGEARTIMVQQVTSAPDSSGESKQTGFEEAVSPLLSRLAGAFETWVNSVLYYYALRAGVKPDAALQMPRRFELRNILADVDKMFLTMQQSTLDSPTLSADMLVRKGDELGLIPQDKRTVIMAELEASKKRHGELAPAQYWSAMAASISEMTKIPGMTPQGAGFLLGLKPEQVDVLRTGVPPGEAPGGPNATPTREEEARVQAELNKRFAQNGGASGNGEEPQGAAANPPGSLNQMPPAMQAQAARLRGAAAPA